MPNKGELKEKARIEKMVGNFKLWFNFRVYSYTPMRVRSSIKKSIFLFLCLYLMNVALNNIASLNSYTILFFRLGSSLFLTLGSVSLFLFCWILVDTRHIFRGLRNGHKLILLILLVLSFFQAYSYRGDYLPKVTDSYNFDYTSFYPLSIRESEVLEWKERAFNPEPEFNFETYEIELLVFKKVNIVRKANGLSELIWDPLLADVARQHSLDMANNSYFSHKNLRGEDPSVRAEERGVDIVKDKGFVLHIGVGENIGVISKGSVEWVADSMMVNWMNSPGHRANILESDYDFIGVGVAYNGYGIYYLTQDFK